MTSIRALRTIRQTSRNNGVGQPRELGRFSSIVLNKQTKLSETQKRTRTNIVDPAWVAIEWTLARAMRTSRFWCIVLGYFCGLAAWYAVQVHQTKYLVEIGFTPLVAAWALGMVSMVGIPGQIVLGALSDRIGREWVWTAGCRGPALRINLRYHHRCPARRRCGRTVDRWLDPRCDWQLQAGLHAGHRMLRRVIRSDLDGGPPHGAPGAGSSTAQVTNSMFKRELL